MRYSLVFDFGGVLMKTADYAPRWAWDDRLGFTRGTVERAVHNDSTWRQAQLGTLPLAEYWTDVSATLGLSAADLHQLQHDFYSGDRLDNQIVELIKRQRDAGQRVALLSNDSPALVDKLEQLGVAALFDPLLISWQIGVMKPDSAAYHAVIERLGCAPQDAVFIDDMPANVAGAQAVGMIGIRYEAAMDLEAALSPYFR